MAAVSTTAVAPAIPGLVHRPHRTTELFTCASTTVWPGSPGLAAKRRAMLYSPSRNTGIAFEMSVAILLAMSVEYWALGTPPESRDGATLFGLAGSATVVATSEVTWAV